jgi:Na+/H+ antiporter NhaC
VPVFAANGDLGPENAKIFGIFTILPPLVAIALAFLTKNVILSLFFGTFTGCYMLELRNGNVFTAFIDGFMRISTEVLVSISDSWNAGIILQVLMIGSLIALITRMGGVHAVAESMAKLAKTPRSTQVVTWILGLFVFFDDYANSLTVGPIMRPVTDKMNISREKLAFIIDATAAPISGMALISTWIAYELGLINDALNSIGADFNAYGMFISSLPFRFYNIFMLIFIFIGAMMLREFGSMYKAEMRARGGEVLRKGSTPMMAETLEPTHSDRIAPQGKAWYAIVPIMTLIVGAFIGFFVNGYNAIMNGEDEALKAILTDSFSFNAVQTAFGASDASTVLFQAALVASIVAILIGLSKRIFNIKEALDTALSGIKSMNITAVILLLAWSIAGVIKELGTAPFIVENLSSSIPGWSLPAIIFILGAIISFSTGTSYGTMGIIMPLAVPLAWAINPEQGYLILNIGAVLTGAIFGDHCSPISDTTILSSMGAACDHIDHVRTQMLYAITIAIVSIFIYILAGFGLNVWAAIAVGIVIVAMIIRFVGKPVPSTI